LQKPQSPTDDSFIAFLYCDHTDQREQTPTNLIGSLLAQLSTSLPEDHDVVKQLQEQRSMNKLLDLDSGIDYIRQISMSLPSNIIRLGADGLDELQKEHRSTFLHALASLFDLPNIYFLFFGRDHSGLQGELDSCFQKQDRTIIYLEITGGLTVGDRRLFIQDKLDKDLNGQNFDEELCTLIVTSLAPSDSTYGIIDYYPTLRLMLC
jgi:hypothetical protein